MRNFILICLSMILLSGLVYCRNNEIEVVTEVKSFSFMIPAITISSGCYLYIVVSDRKFNLPSGTTDLMKLNGIRNKCPSGYDGYGSINGSFELNLK